MHRSRFQRFIFSALAGICLCIASSSSFAFNFPLVYDAPAAWAPAWKPDWQSWQQFRPVAVNDVKMCLTYTLDTHPALSRELRHCYTNSWRT